jgi:hypothetical protein
MALVTVEVPAALAGLLRETLILLYQATTEALHFTLREHGKRGGRLPEVHDARARLAELDGLLEQLGWSARCGQGPIELTATRDVLHDALYGALIDAGERLATACSRSYRDDAEWESVRAAAEEVLALDGLLRTVREQGRGPTE